MTNLPGFEGVEVGGQIAITNIDISKRKLTVDEHVEYMRVLTALVMSKAALVNVMPDDGRLSLLIIDDTLTKELLASKNLLAEMEVVDDSE